MATPNHSRNASGISVYSPISERQNYSYPTQSRRQSNASHASYRSQNSFGSRSGSFGGTSPNTPGGFGGHRREDSLRLDDGIFSSGGRVPDNGLGNLADELAGLDGDEEEWDEDDNEPDMNFQNGAQQAIDSDTEEQAKAKQNGTVTRDSGVSVSGTPNKKPPSPAKIKTNLSPPKRHRRSGSEYDGSDYGTNSDVDETGLPPGLIERMDNIESLARRGTESNGSATDSIVPRLVSGLRDLGGQGGVETGATRLITSHTALSTHLLYQTRTLQTLSHAVVGPFALPLEEEIIDELLPLLESLSQAIPRPERPALQALASLGSVSDELVESLGGLGDSLHMSRQSTTLGARRLKAAKELVRELNREEEVREQAVRWIRKENWEDKLRKREAKSVADDVVRGFEEVCEGWRRKLVELERVKMAAASA